ncbi:uncharacterized protein KGF55_001909 [Candida pseudojiufengensis]|uniref:uncharacterized protein n=1 Tax=Candida pseudojiufengensis TaxID=497109 RepID=UPI0022259FFF|nr:uncharacterized protein KGF55_001909 [Candida pseudojiufengensis]KAI5964839.1 hypothetical protein KGF55_001909 [Candida pseudojiufengensis]
MNTTLSIMEDIENYYQNKRSNTQPFTHKEFESLDNHNIKQSTTSISNSINRKNIPLQESSINTLKTNNLLSSKSFTSPIKPIYHNNSKKRSPNTPTIALASQHTKRRFDLPKLELNATDLSPIKHKGERLKLQKVSENKEELISMTEQTKPEWFALTSREAKQNMELYISQQKLSDMEEITEFLIMERKFEIEAGL